MAYKNQRLILQQVDAKIKALPAIHRIPPPGQGWINGIRTALGMTLDQLATKLGITAQSLKEAELREMEGSITLKSLRQIAAALNMHFAYAIVPDDGTLEDIINKKVEERAAEIVSRTSQTMALEDQENSAERLQMVLEEKKIELKSEMPKYLWD
jgi:predicted DNA-binding mobile mystery protein A